VHQIIKDLYKKKVLAIFIKLDISNVFYTVIRSFLLDILTYLGFSRWRNWIVALWETASSSFLINGAHRHGRQGDSLSVMLFLLVMELLHMLFRYAQDSGALSHHHENYATSECPCTQMTTTVSIQPTARDFLIIKQILQIFGGASGPATNWEKTEFSPFAVTP
jgi:hypothetical protein